MIRLNCALILPLLLFWGCGPSTAPRLDPISIESALSEPLDGIHFQTVKRRGYGGAFQSEHIYAFSLLPNSTVRLPFPDGTPLRNPVVRHVPNNDILYIVARDGSKELFVRTAFKYEKNLRVVREGEDVKVLSMNPSDPRASPLDGAELTEAERSALRAALDQYLALPERDRDRLRK